MSDTKPKITLCRWARPEEGPFAEPVFMFDGADLPESLANVSVVLRTGGAERARELSARGAERVLIGDAALKDSTIVAPLARELGAEKLGLWIAVRRMSVSWALDYESNADFRCITPSRAKPAWEAVLSDGTGTGTDVMWWTGQMFAGGASMALIAADIGDDTGLNICAEMTEQFGPRLWLTPQTRMDADLRPWVLYGHVHNLVVPGREYYDDDAMAALSLSSEAGGQAPELSPAREEIVAA